MLLYDRRCQYLHRNDHLFCANSSHPCPCLWYISVDFRLFSRFVIIILEVSTAVSLSEQVARSSSSWGCDERRRRWGQVQPELLLLPPAVRRPRSDVSPPHRSNPTPSAERTPVDDDDDAHTAANGDSAAHLPIGRKTDGRTDGDSNCDERRERELLTSSVPFGIANWSDVSRIYV